CWFGLSAAPLSAVRGASVASSLSAARMGGAAAAAAHAASSVATVRPPRKDGSVLAAALALFGLGRGLLLRLGRLLRLALGARLGRGRGQLEGRLAVLQADVDFAAAGKLAEQEF